MSNYPFIYVNKKTPADQLISQYLQPDSNFNIISYNVVDE